MDKDYARLSWEVGLFAGRADSYLGQSHFAPKCRAIAWELTPAILEQLRQEAREMGVPDEILEKWNPANE